MIIPNMAKITTFREVLEWISYDLDYNYTLSKDNRGNFYVNNLYIEPYYLSYKTECAELEHGVFDKVSALYDLLQEDEASKSDLVGDDKAEEAKNGQA